MKQSGALPLSDGGEECPVFGWNSFPGQIPGLIFVGIERRQVIKEDFIAGLLGAFKIDFIHFQQGEIFHLLWGADFAGNGVACPQVKAADLRW